jgi:AcrR family transcriptional regulator
MPPRPSAMDRVPELIRAAVKVFADKGYRATQMADVAAEMGVAPASLYNYVDGKEGLFALCLERMAQGPGFVLEPIRLPFATPPMDVTLKRLHRRVEELYRLPALDVPARGKPSPARAEEELRAVVSEGFALASQIRWAADMIERSAREIPELAALLRTEWRGPMMRRLQDFLRARMDRGELRPVGDLWVAARFVEETINWFARHRHHDREGRELDEAPVKATVTELIVGAFALRQSHGGEEASR